MKNNKISLSPYSYMTSSLKTVSTVLCCLLIPQVLMLIITRSYASILNLGCAVAGAYLAEFAFNYTKKTFSCGKLIVLIQGIMTGLLVPSTCFCLDVLLIVFVVMLLGKYCFGNFAGSWINPIAITVALLYFVDPDAFPSINLTYFDLQQKNAALGLIHSGAVNIVGVDQKITDFFNHIIFRLFRIEIPYGYVSLFWDTGSLIPAFRFNLITLISSLIIFSFELADHVIPVCFIIVYGILVRFFSPVFVGGQFFQGDVLLALLTSGVFFCSFYLLQWFGTTPFTLWGKILYGVLSGIAGFFIIGAGESSAGYVFTVLVSNVFSCIIQYFEGLQVQHLFKKDILVRSNAISGE